MDSPILDRGRGPNQPFGNTLLTVRGVNGVVNPLWPAPFFDSLNAPQLPGSEAAGARLGLALDDKAVIFLTMASFRVATKSCRILSRRIARQLGREANDDSARS